MEAYTAYVALLLQRFHQDGTPPSSYGPRNSPPSRWPNAPTTIRHSPGRKPITAGQGKNKPWSSETVHASTSLAASQISPEELADVLRGQWLIEDRLHWVRDVTYDEDRSQVRPANGPASWPACATSPSPSYASAASSISPPPPDTAPDDQNAHYKRSRNCSTINPTLPGPASHTQSRSAAT